MKQQVLLSIRHVQIHSSSSDLQGLKGRRLLFIHPSIQCHPISTIYMYKYICHSLFTHVYILYMYMFMYLVYIYVYLFMYISCLYIFYMYMFIYLCIYLVYVFFIHPCICLDIIPLIFIQIFIHIRIPSPSICIHPHSKCMYMTFEYPSLHTKLSDLSIII
jgi:hypothetical protein